MADDDYATIFNASFGRAAVSPESPFFDRFYELFMQRSYKIRAKFKGVDMAHQRLMLRHSLLELVGFFTTGRSNEYMEKIAQRHGRAGIDVPPAFYDAWLETLVETVRECDPKFDREVETAWRVVLSPGIEFMKVRYEPERN